MTSSDYDHVEGRGGLYTSQYSPDDPEPPCPSCGENAPIDTEETESHYREWCNECKYLLHETEL